MLWLSHLGIPCGNVFPKQENCQLHWQKAWLMQLVSCAGGPDELGKTVSL